ncbi:MAG TPA: DUF2339 domain-containing protein [Thermoanaerobaculia bacterium]|nr:DUF2339 domain-containing protein [Thermoanaerobaculia bacterium]
MDDLLSGLGCLLVLATPVVIGVAALVARRLSERVGSAESELAALRARLHEVETEVRQLRSTTRPAPAPAPAATPEAARIDAPSPAARAASTAAPPHPEPPPSPASAAVPASPPAAPPAAPQPLFTAIEPSAREASSSSFDWERWLGVRGAAVAGGVVLALAGLYLFKYSVEQGWISPLVRVILGLLAGLGCLVGAGPVRRRGYGNTAEALAGAGFAILYAAFWAAHIRYELLGALPTFLLMAGVTVGCCLFASRWRSLVLASIGLAGGFATPLMVPAAGEGPGRLFGYLLVLNGGLLALARRRAWPGLALFALIATTLHQAVFFLSRHFEPAEGTLGLLILGLFALVFAFSPELRSEGGEAPEGAPVSWHTTQLAALAVPLLVGLGLVGRTEVEIGLPSLGAFLLLLSLAGSWLGRRPGLGPAALMGAQGALIVAAVWLLVRGEQGVPAWGFAALAVALSAVPLASTLYRAPETEVAPHSARAANLATIGFLLVLVLASASREQAATPWPWIAGALVLTAFLLVLGIRTSATSLPFVAAGGMALAFAVPHWVHGDAADAPRSLWLAAALAAGLFQAAAVLLGRRRPEQRDDLERAAAGMALGLLAAWLVGPGLADRPSESLAGPLVFAALAVAPALRTGSAGLFALAAGLLAASDLKAALSLPASPEGQAGPALAAFLVGLLATTALPFVNRALRRQREAWIVAALAGPAFFPSIELIGERLWPDAPPALLPLALAALAGVAFYGMMRLAGSASERSAISTEVARSARAWFGGVAIAFVTLAIPMQLHHEHRTVAWAIEALTLVALWRRTGRSALAWFAGFLLALVSARLLLNPEVLTYHAPSEIPVANWWAYAYLIPAAVLLLTARWLRAGPREPPGSEPRLESDLGAAALPAAAAALVLVFAWINLTILDAFATGAHLLEDWTRHPARDLTLSLAWAVYALVLLGLGVAGRSKALRRTGLGVLIATLLKVFLYDLGELSDLYRVASLVGLALSLLLVSIGYQRWLAKDDSVAGGEPEARSP